VLEAGVAASFAAGVVSFLSPCILPLVPAYLCFLAGASLDSLNKGANVARWRVVGRAAAFVTGFSLIFIALGASASTLGQLISDRLALLSQIAGIIIVLLGLHMLGVFRLVPLMREARFRSNQPAGLLGALVVGLAFGFGWTPCVGPVLASILLLATSEDTVWHGTALLTAYAAGIGVPFLLAAIFTGSFLRWFSRFRGKLGAIEKVMGAALVATGVFIFSGLMPLLGAWLLETVPILGRIG
jgi:cytochrome c-type biogenesis protein